MVWKQLPFLLSCIVFITGTAIIGTAVDAPPVKRGSPEHVARLKWLIQNLANAHNTRPKVFRRGPTAYPLFNEEYDENEQRRVKRVLAELVGEMGDELWPLLIEVHDDRYALTIEADERSENESVNSLCLEMTDDLMLPFNRHMPKVDLGNNYRLYPKSKWSPLGKDVSIRKWAAARPDKKLHELQIEICELTIAAIPTMKELSELEKEKFIAGQKGEIDMIRKTGEPVVRKDRFRGEYYVIYSAKRIAKYREKHEQLNNQSSKTEE